MLKNWVESLGKKIQKTAAWFSFFKKLLSRSRSKIERNNKTIMSLKWNQNALIPMVRLF